METSPEKLSPVNNSMQRVKVYRLNDVGKWDDQGTGHVTIDYMENSNDMGLHVIDEEDNETLLVHRISSDDIYRKQDDTIITWRDAEFASDLALSFQEDTGCSFIWDNICSVQRNIHFTSLSNEAFHSPNSELRELPAVEISTLPLLLKNVAECSIPENSRVAELILHDVVICLPSIGQLSRVLPKPGELHRYVKLRMQSLLLKIETISGFMQEFFQKLMALFRICEDLDNVDGLHMIYKIVRGVILLNSLQIFEKIFGDELIMDIIGVLEYEPAMPHVHHRTFLKEHIVFKEAIRIKDPLVLSKIHQTYRVGYLRDVVLPRALDEHTLASLNSIIQSNNAVVVSLLKDDSTFIQELFLRLKSSSTSADSKKKLVSFLLEFCSLIKSLQMVQQLRLLRDLVNEGAFDIIADVLQSDDKKLVLAGTDILVLFLNQDPNLLRSHVTRQEGVSLLGLLVKGMLTDFGDDMHCQFLDILRSLLDSNTSAQREAIIKIFYEKHFGEIIGVITSSCPTNGALKQAIAESASSSGSLASQRSATPEILNNICDLLCFCILHHPYIIKPDFLLNGVVDKVLLLTRRKEKYLVVAAVRFVRILISCKDEHLMNHIVKNNTFKPIIDAFVCNGSRYNLLNSTVLELFEYIRKENLNILLKYLVESYWDQLVKFENLPSIRSFKVTYEQSLESSGTRNGPPLLYTRRRNDDRALEKEEEDYFNKESEEEDSTPASMPSNTRVRAEPSLPDGSAASCPSPRSGGLVDYEDDEDDEDYDPIKRGATLNKDGEKADLISKRKLLDSMEEPVLHDSEDHKPPPRKQRVMRNSEEGEPVEGPGLPDEEGYKTPPRKQMTESDNEEADDLVLPKRTLEPKEEPELIKKQRLVKSSKSKVNAFTSLGSTLIQAALPTTKTSGAQDNVSDSGVTKKSNGEEGHEEKGSESDADKPISGSNDGSQEGNEEESSSSCLEETQAPDNRERGREECPLIPPKCSPEKAIDRT